jgi:AraC-like DNA-binding protein
MSLFLYRGKFPCSNVAAAGNFLVFFARNRLSCPSTLLAQGCLPKLRNRHLVEGILMNTKLNQIQDWLSLAPQANWSVTSLAKQFNVSSDTLRRHFRWQFGKSPKQWMMEQRQHEAIALLREGKSVKETAFRLGYKQQTNFARQFRGFWGVCPSKKQRHPVFLLGMHEND